MYRTIMTLTEACRKADGTYLVTFKLSNSYPNGTMLVPNKIVEFNTHTIKDAIDNIELNEIEELHITKIIKHEYKG